MITSNEDLPLQHNQGNKKMRKDMGKGGASGAFYGMGVIGAAIYFVQHATSFMDGVVGILKAIIWPAFVAYKFFEFFKF